MAAKKGGKPVPEKDEKGRFVTGNIGGGRPKGARAVLGEQFLQAMQADFEQNGIVAIATVREERPQDYLKIIASILPKDVNLNVNNMDDLSDDELIRRIRRLDAAIRPFLDAEGAGGFAGGTGPAQAH